MCVLRPPNVKPPRCLTSEIHVQSHSDMAQFEVFSNVGLGKLAVGQSTPAQVTLWLYGDLSQGR